MTESAWRLRACALLVWTTAGCFSLKPDDHYDAARVDTPSAETPGVDASDVVIVDVPVAMDVADNGPTMDVADNGPTTDVTDSGPTTDVADAADVPTDVPPSGAPRLTGGFVATGVPSSPTGVTRLTGGFTWQGPLAGTRLEGWLR